MGSTYTLGTFLRQTPNVLLQRYFAGQGLLGDVDFGLVGARDARLITDGLNRLSPADRSRVDLDFQDVHVLADRFATRIVMDVAGAHEPELVPKLAQMENHFARAMWLFLERRRHPGDLFDQCFELVQVEQIRFTRSKRRNSLPHQLPAADPPALMLLAEGVKEVYQAQGRGQNCRVEVFERRNPHRFYYVGYPEDYATSELEYEGSDLRRRSRRSVFDVAWLFRPDEGVLEIHAPGRKDEIEALQRVFCESALGRTAPPHGNDRCFDLDRMLRSGFAFSLDPADDIDRIEVCAMRLVRIHGRQPRVTFETAPTSLADFLRQVVEELKTPLTQLTATTVKLRAVWRGGDQSRPKIVTFSLSSPDTSDLKDTPEHVVLKRRLKAWGVAS